MPRYFFHVTDGYSIRDTEGTELTDIYTAQDQAIRTSSEILREMGAKFWDGTEWTMEVTLTRALRVPQVSYRDQLRLVAPLLAGLDRLVFDSGGVGDAVAELLPRDAIPAVIVAGSASPLRRGGRIHVGKAWLIGQILTLAGAGRLRVEPACPGGADFRRELAAFAVTPTRRGVKLEARGTAHDDLVLALGLAVLSVSVSNLN